MFLKDWKTHYAHLRHIDDGSFYYSYRTLMHFDATQADKFEFLIALQHLYNHGFIKHKIAVNLKIGVHNIMNDFNSISEMTHYIKAIRDRYARSPTMTLAEADAEVEIRLANALFSRVGLQEDIYTVTGTEKRLDTFTCVNNDHWCVTNDCPYLGRQTHHCAPGTKPVKLQTIMKECLNDGTTIPGKSSFHYSLCSERDTYQNLVATNTSLADSQYGAPLADELQRRHALNIPQ
jgi:hypothetical protein